MYQLRRREETAVRAVIAELMDKHGGYQRPEIRDVLWVKVGCMRLDMIINRPGVAGAVLQSPPSLID